LETLKTGLQGDVNNLETKLTDRVTNLAGSTDTKLASQKKTLETSIAQTTAALDGRLDALETLHTKKSCLEYLIADPKAKSGVYTIEYSRAKTRKVYCDMTTDGGGWTICYNHDLQNLEEMNHATTARLSNVIGNPGFTSEHTTDCVGLGEAMRPSSVRMCTKNCEHWIELVNVDTQFHRSFWTCTGRHQLDVTVKTYTGKTFYRKANLHDCPKSSPPGGAINQIGYNTNDNICFENNGKNGDSNHHWAIYGNCNGRYVGADNNNDRKGWARVMLR